MVGFIKHGLCMPVTMQSVMHCEITWIFFVCVYYQLLAGFLHGKSNCEVLEYVAWVLSVLPGFFICHLKNEKEKFVEK